MSVRRVTLAITIVLFGACDAERIDFVGAPADAFGPEAAFADGAAPDAAEDVAVDAGFSSNPNAISCGSTTCDPTTAFCCALPDAGALDLSCETSGGACNGGGVIHCDEAADCPAGNVCCWDTSGPVLASDCHTDCTGGGGTRYQACKTTAECLSGACAVHACSGGIDVTSCGPVGTVCP